VGLHAEGEGGSEARPGSGSSLGLCRRAMVLCRSLVLEGYGAVGSPRCGSSAELETAQGPLPRSFFFKRAALLDSGFMMAGFDITSSIVLRLRVFFFSL
jgi:hypothetical protein